MKKAIGVLFSTEILTGKVQKCHFPRIVKKEICSVEQFDREALKAELYGMLLFSRNFSPNKITFTTESNYAGNRLNISFAEFIYADN